MEWDFSDMTLRKQYQENFGRALMSGNLASCVDLHKEVPGYPKPIEPFESQYYERFAVTLFGERD